MQVKPWQIKIENSNKYFKQWEERFRCRLLEEYYEGYQWKSIIDIPFYKPYVVNLIYAELKKKLANILHQRIQYELSPTPASFEWNADQAMTSAQLKQDALNTLKDSPNVNFKQNVRLCAKDSYFRFAVMEVGYAADWKNPNKTPPLTTAHDSDIDIKDSKLIEDFEIPENERIYFKRIKPSRFRVSVSDSPFLNNCSWCGYYSYFYKSTLLKSKNLKLTSDAKDKIYSSEYANIDNYLKADGASADSKDMREALKRGEVSIVWNIWDNEEKKRKLVLDSDWEEIWVSEHEYDDINLVTHVHDERLDGFYPIPPIYQWLSPQDEINQAREQMRNYRRRFTRKFTYTNVDQEELEKFKSETDGELIKLKQNGNITAVNNPEIGTSILDSLTSGHDDFNTVSGSSTDLNSIQSDRTTATQSKILQAKSSIIENFEQISFNDFYISAGRLGLKVIKENFSSQFMINSGTTDPQFLGAANAGLAPVYKIVYPHQLNDAYDAQIEFSIIDSSPLRMEEELNKAIKFLSLVTQFPQISLSPYLIKEFAYRCGFRNNKVIAEMQRVALLQMMGQAAQMGGGGQVQQLMQGQNPNNTLQQQMATPNDSAMAAQLLGQ